MFGSAVSGLNISVSWRLGSGARTVVREEAGPGRGSVSIGLDLNKAMRLLDPTRPCGESPQVDAFLVEFLHELGHVLYESAAGRMGEGGVAEVGWPVGIPDSTETRDLLDTIRDTLEDARVERHLLRDFRGARRHLQGHALQVAHMAEAHGGTRLNRLVAVLFLELWGGAALVCRERLPSDVRDTADRLRESLLTASSSSGELGAWLVRELLPRLGPFLASRLISDHQSAVQQEQLTEPAEGRAVDRPAAEDGAGRPPRRPEEDGGGVTSAVDSTAPDARTPPDGPSEEIRRTLGRAGLNDHRRRLFIQGALTPEQEELAERRVITYPHVDGGMVVMDEIGVAQARDVAQDRRTAGIWADVVGTYGPWAVGGFAAHRAALRRAFGANCRCRFDGRYRSGHRIGVANARRFVVREDLRLFQHMDLPIRPSYYFHLLVDVSPSMLRDDNVHKALACAYAFTDVLVELRISVDVSLYSSAVTQLFDHAHDRLEPYFGGSGGFLSSGTHEVEAIAFAKQRADAVAERSKLIVVMTDGHPNAAAAARAGADGLGEYYRGAFASWLARSGIELLCIGSAPRWTTTPTP